MKCSRNHLVLWLALFAGCLAVVALIFIAIIGVREIQREFYRVVPEESAAYAWIAEKRGTLGKEGKDRHIVNVNLAGANVSDSELERLLDLPHLRRLDLSGTQITDAGLHTLLCLKELEYVDLSNTRVTADGYMAFVARHPKLKKRAGWGNP